MEWVDFPPDSFYFPHEPRVVVALADAGEPLGLPSPYADEDRWFLDDAMREVHYRRVSLGRPLDFDGLPPLAGEGRHPRRFDITFIPLFPTAPEELPEVARAWTALLEAPEPPGIREGHRFYLASEVADDFSTLPRLLENELALWEAARRLRPSREDAHRAMQVSEALELARLVVERFLTAGRLSYGVASTALEDLVRRTLVTDNLFALRGLLPA